MKESVSALFRFSSEHLTRLEVLRRISTWEEVRQIDFHRLANLCKRFKRRNRVPFSTRER
jgi:hypothetical protein